MGLFYSDPVLVAMPPMPIAMPSVPLSFAYIADDEALWGYITYHEKKILKVTYYLSIMVVDKIRVF